MRIEKIMNTCFTLEPFVIPDQKMSNEYPQDLAGDSSMSTAFEEDYDPLLCGFDMHNKTTMMIAANSFGGQSSQPLVTPAAASALTAFNCEPFECNPITPAFDPLHLLVEPTPIVQHQPMDISYRSVSSATDSTCTTKTSAELEVLCEEGIVKLRESIKRSSATRQEILRQRKILGY